MRDGDRSVIMSEGGKGERKDSFSPVSQPLLETQQIGGPALEGPLRRQ